jgi:manganese/zinc/iron transport system permease protein
MGNVDALHIHDLKLISLVGAMDFLFFFFLFKEFKITAFDPQFANSLGISNHFFNYLLMVLVSATCIGAFRAVGVLLVLAFLVGPPLTARFLTDRLGHMLVLAISIGGICSFVAVALARHLLSVYQIPLSTGGLVVVMIALAYLLALIFSPKKGLIAKNLSLKRKVLEKKDMESIY